MNALQFLRRRVVGTINGEPVMSRRSFRVFLIALLAGRTTVVLNARISPAGVTGTADAVFAGNTFGS